ncbi:hypothetical protein HAZT_HAZT006995 [Hyalella azteca]|uniref:Uncharacterized protein n=1 Tax=Hyalella azteca TaxID=294128 RepID=A0A6A0GWP4_HYAAZ|nr:hypothetical protein HAZT_HAZT006995 [Hyalella azteca]
MFSSALQVLSWWFKRPKLLRLSNASNAGTPAALVLWVADGSPTHSNAVKLDASLQFVPKDTDPKEFKKIQKAIKENRRIGNLSAGPTSHLLEGVTWDEVRRMQDATISNAADHTVLVGAASKGIIQRDFQHNAVVYKTPYAKNPFDAISDQELDDYKLLVERKQRGEPIEEIEVEKLHISPERAERGIVGDMGDGFDATSPLSPLSDTDGQRISSTRRTDGTQLVVHTQVAPRAGIAHPVCINDEENICIAHVMDKFTSPSGNNYALLLDFSLALDGVSVQSLTLSTRSVGGPKPPVPPKPKTLPPPSSSVPALNAQQTRDQPQRVHANVKVLPPRPCVSCPPVETGIVATACSASRAGVPNASVNGTIAPTDGSVANYNVADEAVPILRKDRMRYDAHGTASDHEIITKNDTARMRPASLELTGETAANGEDTEAHHSALSQSRVTDERHFKKKKKKKGLRTPSFLKMKKDKKREKEALHQ